MLMKMEEWLDDHATRSMDAARWVCKPPLEETMILQDKTREEGSKALQMLTPILSIVSLDKFKSEIYKESTSIYSLRCWNISYTNSKTPSQKASRISEVMVFVQYWWWIVTNASKMRCEKFGCKRNWSWLGFGLAKFGGLAFFALVEKLVTKWSYGFFAILVGKCHKCIKNDVWKVWLQKELIFVGFWLSQVRCVGFFCLGSKIGE